MLHKRTGNISAHVSAKVVVAILALAFFTANVAAQCPTMSSEGFTFGTTNFNTVKAQMWYNDGIWWGAFSDNFDGIHFYSFPNNAAVQGPIIDGNITGIPDALWDGTNLYISIWKSVSLATLYKYTYNSVTKQYALISGFPVNLPLTGGSTSALVLEKDSTGKLWATYTGTQGGVSDGKVRVIWSTSADHKTWNTTGFELESGLTPNVIEISAITHFGGNKIGIAWSNQVLKQIAFRYHIDGQAETTWSTKEIIDSGLGPRGLGGVADDHLSIRAHPDGRIFLAAKDNDNDGIGARAAEGRVWLYVRTVAGTWGQKTIVQPDFSQLPTRPVLLLDVTNNRAYVIYHDESPSGAGRNFIAHTDLDNLGFDFPCVFNMTGSSNPTSTRQNVTPATGIMVAASTGSTGSNEIVFRSVVLPQAAVVSALSPSNKLAGSAAFQLTVTGSGFADGSFVQFNGADRLTQFISANELRADILVEDVAFAGTYPITVYNPSTGTVSNSLNFTVNNPAPTLSSISPTSKTAGEAAFTLTVNGSNFVFGSVVHFNGSARTTSFFGANQLMAQISAADIQTAGSFPITVVNAGPGGGTSGQINLVVNSAPLPVLNSISPTTKTVGDVAFSLTVNGQNFVGSSVVRFNGSDRTTTFVNSNQLTAQISAADMQAAGSYPITVFTPSVGTSSAINLTVNNPVPAISTISPSAKNAGEAAFTLTVNGSNFINGSIVRLNGNDRTTAFVNSTQLTAQISAADIQTAGSYPVTVFNGGPGGGTSNAINLTVNPVVIPNPTPSLTSLSPSNKQANSGAFTLTVNGSNFVASSEVRWNGQARVTTFVNATQLTAQINASDITASGSAAVTVFNPAPGGGLSNSLTFTIDQAPTSGYESDVAPRPNGSNNGSVTVSDWVQTGRFSAGLDTPNPGSEFQRADSAPRGSLGNGAITVSDWVQAGRYAAGLDPVTPAGGPTAPPSAPEKLGPGASGIVPEGESDRIIRIVGPTLIPGQAAQIAVEMDSQGNENALGFSINFDPTKLTYVSTALGSGASGTQMNVNSSQAGSGRVGIAMSQPAGSNFAPGTRQLAVLTFNVLQSASGSTVVDFGNVPIFREIVDAGAQELSGTYVSATLNIVAPDNPIPSISSLSQNSAMAGAPGFTLTVNGTNFIAGSVVKWNGSARSTTVVSTTQLTAQISAADIQSSGVYLVTVSNPAPAGGDSNSIQFTVNNPVPAATGLSVSSALVNDAPFTLTVSGTNFVPGASVAWNGDNRTTTFVSSTQLTAQILASDLSTAGNVAVTVSNPAPGGGVSNSLTFTVNNRVPAVIGISPGIVVAGGPNFGLTVTGNDFVSGSIVRLNGMDRVTAFSNSGELTAQILAADIASAGSATITVFNPGPGGGTSSAVMLTINPPPPALQFSAQTFNSSEGAGSAVITVSRTGDTSGSASVDYGIGDPVGYASCLISNGLAAQNCDYTIISGTLEFAPGETSKTFRVPLIDDLHVEMDETLNLKLSNAVGASLGATSTTSLMIVDNDSGAASSNPIDAAEFFVRQHYLDFLNREPDSGGLGYWSSRINECLSDSDPQNDVICLRDRRIGVSGAFFVELEFQQTGSVVYRLHKAAFGQRPSYVDFMPDRSQLVAGPQLLASTQTFASRFVLRQDFKNAYPDAMSNADFVNKLFDSAELMNNQAQRDAAIAAMNSGAKSRAQVLLDLIEIEDFKQREYNPSFVLMQYFGYLRRDPDQGGFDFWLNVLNNQEPNNYQGMICSFLTSREYQQRFSPIVTSSNSDCGQ